MIIPRHAKKVFEGIIFDTYQWEQELFDGTTTTFEAIKRQSTVEIIPVLENEKIAIASEIQPGMKNRKSTLFCGKVDGGEGILRAAKRELLEESGLESDDWELWAEGNVCGRKIKWQWYTYIARNCKKIQDAQLEAGEDIKVHEYNFNKFVDIATSTDFWSKDFSNQLYRLKTEGKLEEFKNKLFKK